MLAAPSAAGAGTALLVGDTRVVGATAALAAVGTLLSLSAAALAGPLGGGAPGAIGASALVLLVAAAWAAAP
ncbi:hypothetical protein INN71_00920 [Nocardioides sp. ChNu-153]|uniref:hypothetical protein n=1 Tax=unclassified Nocardioides TaxID=2615069 RepID=UPI002405BA50|nr:MULTISPECIES: hypothetical protein [unclassified Nocardioides]MDF9715978.1 hypothetical protein [Nocardioides sp. ChNu-99]MDN7119946.1 hypothetical protein [Nocardioides sp. ChNu-153]